MRLNYEKTGAQTVERLGLYKGYAMDFEMGALGFRCYERKWFIIGLVANKWVILDDTQENRELVMNHGYLVNHKRFKRITRRIPHKVEDFMKHNHHSKDYVGEIHTSRPDGKQHVHVMKCSAGGLVIKTKRFENSRVTCVYKTSRF